jgi:hypothetical protein
MAMILEFPEMQVPVRRRAERRSKPAGEVVLFPGVRYERWNEIGAEHGAVREAVVRDRLKLIE